MKTNYLAIAACAVINAVLGMGWYGIFSQQWMAGNNLTEAAMNARENPTLPVIVSIAVALIAGYLFTVLFRRMQVADWTDGAKTGFTIGLFGFFGTIVGNMYAMRPMALSLIDGGFVLLQFAAFGAVIGGWQKR